VCRMVRMCQTARKKMEWHPPIPIQPADLESELEVPEDESSDNEIQIIEPSQAPPVPVIDLVFDSKDEMEIIEPLLTPPPQEIDLTPDSDDSRKIDYESPPI
jgi:hypothetical protein